MTLDIDRVPSYKNIKKNAKYVPLELDEQYIVSYERCCEYQRILYYCVLQTNPFHIHGVKNNYAMPYEDSQITILLLMPRKLTQTYSIGLF